MEKHDSVRIDQVCIFIGSIAAIVTSSLFFFVLTLYYLVVVHVAL